MLILMLLDQDHSLNRQGSNQSSEQLEVFRTEVAIEHVLFGSYSIFKNYKMLLYQFIFVYVWNFSL